MVNNTWPSPRGRRYSSSAYLLLEGGNEIARILHIALRCPETMKRRRAMYRRLSKRADASYPSRLMTTERLINSRLYPFCFRKVIAELGFVFNAWELCEACFSG